MDARAVVSTQTHSGEPVCPSALSPRAPGRRQALVTDQDDTRALRLERRVYAFVLVCAIVTAFADAATFAGVRLRPEISEMSPLASVLGPGWLAGVACKSIVVACVLAVRKVRQIVGEPLIWEIGMIWFFAVGFAYGAWTNVVWGW
jgi:hypothetical protein